MDSPSILSHLRFYFLIPFLSRNSFQVKPGTTKYEHLLSVLEELGKDIKPTYTGNKICSERLKRNIIQARIVIRFVFFNQNIDYFREALLEVEKDRQKAAAEALNKAQ